MRLLFTKSWNMSQNNEIAELKNILVGFIKEQKEFNEETRTFIKGQEEFNGETRTFIKGQEKFNEETRTFIKGQEKFNEEQKKFNEETRTSIKEQKEFNWKIEVKIDRFQYSMEEYIAYVLEFVFKEQEQIKDEIKDNYNIVNPKLRVLMKELHKRQWRTTYA